MLGINKLGLQGGGARKGRLAAAASRRVSFPYSRRRSILPLIETLEVRQLLSTWTVTSLSDKDPTHALHTLRWAIQQADAAYGDQTISFDPQLTANAPATITLNGTPLEINSTTWSGTLIIDGPGASLLTIDANQSSGVFVVDSENSAEIDNLTITGGRSDGMGAGINSQGTLTISNCTVSGNAGLSGAGGSGIYSDDQLTINNSVITGNSSYGSGGGIYNGGELTVSNSTISYNTSTDSGGGIYDDSGSLSLSNSTVHGNSANIGGGIDMPRGGEITACTISGNSAYDGGGIASGYVQFSIVNSAIINNTATHDGGGVSVVSPYGATITNCTIAGNSAGFYGGGISDVDQMVTYGSLNLTDDTISQNAPDGGMAVYHYDEGNSTVTLNGTIADDLAGYGFTGTYNLIADGSGGLTGSTNIQGNPHLGALADNGGPTETMALLAGSPAIGAGSSFESTDQRGAPRFDSFDIGAYQSNPMHIFNGTNLGGSYDFDSIGVPQMIVEGAYKDGNTTYPLLTASGPSQIAAQGLATEAAAGSGYLCFDVEGKPSGFTGDYNAALIQLVTWARQVDSNLKIGFYGDDDGDLTNWDLYEASYYTTERDNTHDAAWRGIQPDGKYNEADDVYRAIDFISPVDYPAEYNSWLYQRLADLEIRDANTDAAARTVTDTDGTVVNIPAKPVYCLISAQYIAPNTQSAGPMAGNDLKAILAQLDSSADGVILWEAGAGQDNFDNWFSALGNFATQRPDDVAAPLLTANSNTMQLSWTDSDPRVQGFEIYRSVHGQNDWIKVGYTPADVMNWADQQMHEDITEPGTPIDATFDYKVRAITGVPTIYADSNIADAAGSGIAPGRDGYAENLAVGWNDSSGAQSTHNWATTQSDLDEMQGTGASGGWVEYSNVYLPSGATSLNLNLAMINTSTQVTIKLWYGAPPGDPGSTLAGSLVVTPTTSDTSVWDFGLNDYAQQTMAVNIPSGTDSNIYIQFISSSSTPNNLVWMRGWNFVA